MIGRQFAEELTQKVKDAKSEIKILIYEWRWYRNEIGTSIQKFNYEVIKARQRGVAVRVIVNKDWICNFLKQQKIEVKKINSKRVMHVKMVMVDNKYLFLGSHNLTKNAFELNHEVSVLIEDQDAIEKCNNFFQTAWAL